MTAREGSPQPFGARRAMEGGRRTRARSQRRKFWGEAMQPRSRYFVREADIPGYSPANHTGTLNRRLISPDTVGSKQIEVLLGTIEKNRGALPHAHPEIEQVCYLLAGTACAEVAGERMEYKPQQTKDTDK